jgi:hypothetical protein
MRRDSRKIWDAAVEGMSKLRRAQSEGNMIERDEAAEKNFKLLYLHADVPRPLITSTIHSSIQYLITLFCAMKSSTFYDVS